MKLHPWRALVVRAFVLPVLATGAVAADTPNPIHPAFPILDAQGGVARITGDAASATRTCGACHDIAFIRGHDTHRDRGADCIQCHFEGGHLPDRDSAYTSDGSLVREAITIGAPRNDNCALCHGLSHGGTDPLTLPEAGIDVADLTLLTGEIFSGQDLSESFLNVEGKDDRDYSWGVHAQRLLQCVDCHYAANDPERPGAKQSSV
ncbi:MAG: hypothetical protein KC729_19575, partial [Candidatus Eisenbacteria bacterium]|nr:hypothetical protein [Candidatus Eisenbacteria bacterium]